MCAALVLGGCAQTGYSAPRVQDELRRAGVRDAAARCITSGFERTFSDTNELDTHSDPTDRELAAARRIIVGCGVTLPPSPRR